MSEPKKKFFVTHHWMWYVLVISYTKNKYRQQNRFVFILLLPAPVVSLRTIASSMYLIFIRTNRKYILPTITSLRWYLQECKKGENNSFYTFVSQFYVQYGILKRQEFCCIKWPKKDIFYIHHYLWKIKDFYCISVEPESG